MEKESIKRFISQFDAIFEASLLLKETTDDRRTKSLTKDIEHCCKIQENPKLLHDAITEIENNLYSFPAPEHRIIYIKDLLRLFVNIAPYFDDKTETEWGSEWGLNRKSGASIVPGAKYTMQVVNNFCNGDIKNLDILPIEARYVIDCFTSLHHFAPLLDAKCHSFDIDLQEIQNEVEIYIQHNRQWDTLSHYGYKQKELNKSEPQTGKPTVNESDNTDILPPMALEHNNVLITDIFNLCIEYKIFNYEFIEFLGCVKTGNFVKREGNLEKKLRHLIFKLQTPMGKEWYKKTCENYGLKPARFGGLRNEIDNDKWAAKLDSILEKHIN